MNDRQLREAVLQMMADFSNLFLRAAQSTKLSRLGRKGTFQVAFIARIYERFESGRVLIENGHEFSSAELSRSAMESQASLRYLSKQARGFFVLEISDRVEVLRAIDLDLCDSSLAPQKKQSLERKRKRIKARIRLLNSRGVNSVRLSERVAMLGQDFSVVYAWLCGMVHHNLSSLKRSHLILVGDSQQFESMNMLVSEEFLTVVEPLFTSLLYAATIQKALSRSEFHAEWQTTILAMRKVYLDFTSIAVKSKEDVE